MRVISRTTSDLLSNIVLNASAVTMMALVAVPLTLVIGSLWLDKSVIEPWRRRRGVGDFNAAAAAR